MAAADIRAAAAALPGARAAPGPRLGPSPGGPGPLRGLRAPGSLVLLLVPRGGAPRGPCPGLPARVPLGSCSSPPLWWRGLSPALFESRPAGSSRSSARPPGPGLARRPPVRGPSCPGSAVGPIRCPPALRLLCCGCAAGRGLGPRSLALWGPGVPAPGLVLVAAWFPAPGFFLGPAPPARRARAPRGLSPPPAPGWGRPGSAALAASRTAPMRCSLLPAFRKPGPPPCRAVGPLGAVQRPPVRSALRVYSLPNCQPAPPAPKPGAPIPPAAPMVAGPVKAKASGAIAPALTVPADRWTSGAESLPTHQGA